MGEKRQRILFVCKYNRFRSQVAESYYRKIGGKNGKSAGIFLGRYPLDKQQRELAKQQGIIINKKPETISTALLRETDTIIIVANDVPKEIFKYGVKYLQKIIVWKIPDEMNNSEKNILKIIKAIKKKVEGLVK